MIKGSDTINFALTIFKFLSCLGRKEKEGEFRRKLKKINKQATTRFKHGMKDDRQLSILSSRGSVKE